MTTIGPSLMITGELICQEDITIHGRVRGQIRMEQGAMLLAPTGKVEADVKGTRITIHGTLSGDVAADRIELTTTANVSGTLTAGEVVMQEGATFNGLVDMSTTAKGKARPRPVAVEPVAKAS
jgi:cytoskeletal protein CcmA (bactofilin family)